MKIELNLIEMIKALFEANLLLHFSIKKLNKALFSFATFNIAGITFFSDEIVALLTDDIFNSIRFIDTDGNLKILCDIVEEYEIKSHITKIK